MSGNPSVTLYHQFMEFCFRTYSGVGQDAKLKTSIDSADDNRKDVFPGECLQEWELMFADLGANSDDTHGMDLHITT